MRITLEYKDYKSKEETNINLEILDTFLNKYTVDTYCGNTFRSIIIKFLNNAPIKRIEKQKTLYKEFALIEVKSNFKNSQEVNILEFKEALELVMSSVKNVKKIDLENMDFDLDTFMKLLNTAKENMPKSEQELEIYRKNQESIKRRNSIRAVDHNIRLLKESKRELNKYLSGIRVYSNLNYEGIDLNPYMHAYENIFSSLLRQEDIMLPGYSEIYVEIHKTLDEAKLSGSSADWSRCTYGEIDVSKYLDSDDTLKSKMVLDSISQGLRMISEFDHLNRESIERAIATAEREGMNIELIYIKDENKRYIAKVIYHVSRLRSEKVLFKLNVVDKISQKECTIDIGYIDLWYAAYSINKIKIKKEEIIIEGKKSFRAEISRKSDNLPDMYLFKIDEILK